jgi:hypothetical protein
MPRSAEKGSEKRRSPAKVLNVLDQGASVAGSTYHKRLLACPFEFGLHQVARLAPTQKAEALDTGWLFHQALEVYYRAIWEHQRRRKQEANERGDHCVIDNDFFWGQGAVKGYASAFAALEALEGEPGYSEIYPTVRKCVEAYLDQHHQIDKWEIVAIEENIEYHGAFEYSARLDLVVVDHKDNKLWIIEFKTARYIGKDLVDNYQMDMQILGQVWLLKTCVDTSKLPNFGGVKVCITSKQATPQCVVVDVLPSRHHLEAFERSIRQWTQMRVLLEQAGWPKSLGHCSGYARGYAKCTYYDLCHAQPLATIEDWAEAEPPMGFVRREQEG